MPSVVDRKPPETALIIPCAESQYSTSGNRLQGSGLGSIAKSSSCKDCPVTHPASERQAARMAGTERRMKFPGLATGPGGHRSGASYQITGGEQQRKLVGAGKNGGKGVVGDAQLIGRNLCMCRSAMASHARHVPASATRAATKNRPPLLKAGSLRRRLA